MAPNTHAGEGSKKKESSVKKEDHQFWKSQPIPGEGEDVSANEPYEADKKQEEIRQTPFSLPDGYEWCEIDIQNEAEVRSPLFFAFPPLSLLIPDFPSLIAQQLKELYTLLTMNYVEDEDAMFRFDYTPEFIRWFVFASCPTLFCVSFFLKPSFLRALLVPGFKKSWFPGVRVTNSKKLVAFISAIPSDVRIYDKRQFMVEVNFLCVHKKLRAKRLAPVLIKEITRRVNVTGTFQAVYTAGLKLPGQISSCRYFHRSLNPKKLVETGFSHIGRNNTLARMIKLYMLPENPVTKGFRAMKAADVAAVHPLLTEYLAQFKLAPVFSEAEFAHYFTPQDKVVYSYVVEDPATKKITDFVSFYLLPSSVINHPVHKTLNVAYLYYYAAAKTPLTELVKDALIISKKVLFLSLFSSFFTVLC